MRWRGRRTSSNIEDRRGRGDGFGRSGGGRSGGGRSGGGRMGIRLPRGRGGRVSFLGLAIIVVAALIFGVDPIALLTGGGGMTPTSQAPVQHSQGQAQGPNRIDDETEQFVGVVLADTEEVWEAAFRQSGLEYEPPVLVLFSGRTASGCGAASAASGPFYCPADRKAYLDTDFFRVLEQRLGAGGDFAAAYVIAHEVAHHVQNLLGILPDVHARRARADEATSNRLSVMTELQADCFSGAWARRAADRFGSLEPGDIEEALNAASQIGDDTLQRNAGQAVVPDSFQHGSAEQRVRWFRRGYDTGDPGSCDTFNAETL